MNKSRSFRRQLTLIMAVLIFFQSMFFFGALYLAQVFDKLNLEAYRVFDNIAVIRGQEYEYGVGQLASSLEKTTTSLSSAIQSIAAQYEITAQELYLNDNAYEEAAMTAADLLIDTLGSHKVSGAFIMLNGSNAEKTRASARSAVYIRNSAPNKSSSSTSDYMLERGPIAISRTHKLTTSVGWDLDIVLDTKDLSLSRYYNLPIRAAKTMTSTNLVDYGYWATPHDPLGDNQQVVSYTLPLLDSYGDTFGVVGVEISLVFFTQYYLPASDLPYQNGFYAITSILNETMPMDWYIPAGPLAQSYLQPGVSLSLSSAPDSLMETNLDGLGEMYCSINPLTIYSRNSLFASESWAIVAFVPQSELTNNGEAVRDILLSCIALSTAFALAFSIFYVRMTTRKINALSTSMQNVEYYKDIQFERTGMREIDELATAVTNLTREVISAADRTSRILELTHLPVGGFEVSNDSNQVIITEFIKDLARIDDAKTLDYPTWQKIYSWLTANPTEDNGGVYSIDDERVEGGQRWLRIQESETESGKVGVIFDVTSEIEEHRRLNHALDHDGLTQLLNRNAFKREVYSLIQKEPDKLGAMIFSDLDNLKYINDTYGHDMGDRFIIHAGELFATFNSVGGVVSRISGDEYAVYLHGFDTKFEALSIIDKQYKAFASDRIIAPDGASIRVRFSSGLAWYPLDSDNATDLLKLADFAMYEAKHGNKGTLNEYNEQSYIAKSFLLENREAINKLLDEELIRFAFQPIVDLRSGKIFAYEALMRPMLEAFKSPAEILAVASAQSKLGQLERLVLTKAFKTIDENLSHLGDAKVFINSIPSQHLHDEDRAIIDKNYSHLYDRVVIEVIEAENNSPQILDEKLAYLRQCGMKIAIDDYGSGHSNNLRILALAPNVIKIDMEMIQGIRNSIDKRSLVNSLVTFCHDRGISVVAEGIEVREDLETLIELGVDFGQGYFLARPAFGFEQITAEAQSFFEDKNI